MEGFDSDLLKKYLNLPKNSEICMVIGCGIRSENEFMVLDIEFH